MGIITELFYLPSLEYFTAILDQEEICIDGLERYQKQTYRNRTQILLANKVETLSVPVLGGNKKIQYRNVKIDYHQKWKNVHLRGLQSAYGKAPYFEFFFPYLEKVYQKNPVFLFDLNMELLTVCLKLLKLDVKLSVLEKEGQNKSFTDIRGLLDAKIDFSERGIYRVREYPQLFGADFEPNLSIVDLLFCEGVNAGNILRASQKND